jgi:hypothetical protein
MPAIKLTTATCVTVEKELSKNPNQEQYLDSLWQKLREDDQLLAGSIKNFAVESEDPNPIIYACALVWTLLQIQAQEDKKIRAKTAQECSGPYL